MGLTHAFISGSLTSLALGKFDSLTIGLSVLGSQIPDIDSTKSSIGQILFPVSRYFENNFPHRTITHSLLATFTLTAIVTIIGYFSFSDPYKLIALPIGHLVSCIADNFTKQGVQLFYPSPLWAIFVSNPNRRLTTGSTTEYWVLAFFVSLFFFSYTAVSDFGNLGTAIGLNLGLKSEIVNLYNSQANDYSFKAIIDGYFAIDRTPIKQGEFTIIENINGEFIITDNSGIYKTNENIIVKNIELVKSERTIHKLETIVFDDEDSGKLSDYLDTNKKYIIGEISVDYPEDISLLPDLNTYQNISVSGNNLKFDYFPLSDAIALLKNQYLVGTITIKWQENLN